MKKYLISGLLAVALIGCGSDDTDKVDSNKNNSRDDGLVTIDDNNQEIDPDFKVSMFFKKLGDNGVELDDKSATWKIVEIPETGMMIKTSSLIELSKRYTQYEAREYCKNLTYAGFYDWRLMDKDEGRTFSQIMKYSEVETFYFLFESRYAMNNGGLSYWLDNNYVNGSYRYYNYGRYAKGASKSSTSTQNWKFFISYEYYKDGVTYTEEGKNTSPKSVICVRN